MIKNIIFDFGDIFINLDKQSVNRQLKEFGGSFNAEFHEINNQFEVGSIKPHEFVKALHNLIPKASKENIVDAWNGILLDFPDYRLDFITTLANENRYRLFLLSNTNAIHIPHCEEKMGTEKFSLFKNSFDKFYLSQEIGMRKPNAEIFEFVLNENGLKADETFFIDDTKENTDAAEKLGINCWNLQVGKEDIVDLKSKM